MWNIRIEKIFVKDGFAAINEALYVIAMVNEKEEQCSRAAEILSMLNVEIRAAIDMKFSSEFKLREILVDTSIVETIAEMGTEFTEAGIIFSKLHGVCSSLSLKIL